jgi:DNA polymerase III delta prime subunit
MEEWVEKYRPRKLEDLVIPPDTMKKFKAYIDKGTFPNCTLPGIQGIGKTTLAKIVVRSIPNATYLFVDASVESGIEVVRGKVLSFVDAVGFGEIKFVILDEFDRFSVDAQKSLRGTIEKSIDDTRFIITTNSTAAILDPILSRCSPINLNPPVKGIFKRLLWILEQEKIEVDKEQRLEIANGIVKKHFPDIRAMVKHLEMCCIGGSFEMADFVSDEAVDIIATHISEIVDETMVQKNGNVRAAREYWLSQEPEFNKDYVSLSERMFGLMQTDAEMKIIADHLRWMSQPLDVEIQFTSMVMEIAKCRKSS